MAKHSMESDETSSLHKRPRLSPTALLSENIVKEADLVLEMIPRMVEYINNNHAGDAQFLDTVGYWRHTCQNAKVPGARWTEATITMLDKHLPNEHLMFQSYNETYESFSSIQKQLLFSLPGPSEFAKSWSRYENKFKDRILCFRPPDSRGLPLCTLHDVFRRYCIAVQKPLPDASKTAISAIRSASQLCSLMGQSFSSKDKDSPVTQHSWDYKEDARVVTFDKCMHGILDSFKKSVTLKAKAELNSGVVDGAWLILDVPLGLREMKAEPGAGGDPYMQVVRSYDLSVKVLREKENSTAQGFLREGAPTFLLCVSGPELLVAGGFWDGKTITVEPLGDPCIMFNDNVRVEKLARVLYALAIGITELKERVDQSSPLIYPASTPRIYKSCEFSNQSVSGQLTFMSKLETTNSNRFMFTAFLLKYPSESIPVLVKLVYGQYGDDVHRLLADYNLAPKLHAVSEVEGAPKAYIMEYLDSSSWKPLSDYLSLPNSSAFAASIRLSINIVLDILSDSGKVHGDLRPPNIMINVSPTGQIILVDDKLGEGRANIKLVDFDWGGDASKVHYPLSRNADIVGLTWPGGVIKKSHDCRLVDSWWKNSSFGQG